MLRSKTPEQHLQMSWKVSARKAARVNRRLELERAGMMESGLTGSRQAPQLTTKYSSLPAQTPVPPSHSQLFGLQVEGERKANKKLKSLDSTLVATAGK